MQRTRGEGDEEGRDRVREATRRRETPGRQVKKGPSLAMFEYGTKHNVWRTSGKTDFCPQFNGHPRARKHGLGGK